MAIIFILIWLLNSPAEAGPALPKNILTVNQIIELYRARLNTKVTELGQNYIVQNSRNQVEFISTKVEVCNKESLDPGVTLAAVNYHYSLDKLPGGQEQLIETLNYYGCRKQLIYQEIIATRGNELKPVEFSRYLQGERDFNLAANEVARTYQFLDGNYIEMFSLRLEKNADKEFISMNVMGKNFYSALNQGSTQWTTAVHTFFGFEVMYQLDGSTWKWTSAFDQMSLTIRAFEVPRGRVDYLDNGNAFISANNFQQYFSQFISEGPMMLLANIVDAYQGHFPNTQLAIANGVNQRLINELEVNFSRLLRRQDLNLVQNYILELKESIKSGLVKIQSDRRP